MSMMVSGSELVSALLPESVFRLAEAFRSAAASRLALVSQSLSGFELA